MVLLFYGIPKEYEEESKIKLLYRYIDQRSCSSKCTLDYCITAARIYDYDYYILPISTDWEFSSLKKCLDLVEKFKGIRLSRQYFTSFIKISDPKDFFKK
jgi:hypothetical protein